MDAEYRPAPRRAVRRRARPRLLPLLLGLLLFAGGFFLGRTSAATAEPAPASRVPQAPDRSPAGGPQPEPSAAPAGSAPELPAPEEDWRLLLVNWEHPLPEDFQVPELTQLKNDQAIDSRAYPDLQEMMDGARAAGLQPLICSSYRTWDYQKRLFQNKVRRLVDAGRSPAEAEAEAATWVARPGTSEHQMGLAVDIVDMSYQVLDEGQEDTAVQQWLMAHCAEYGFILRYPTGKSELTGVSYEPWHYRYVGREAAREIMEDGLCLEEYLN